MQKQKIREMQSGSTDLNFVEQKKLSFTSFDSDIVDRANNDYSDNELPMGKRRSSWSRDSRGQLDG